MFHVPSEEAGDDRVDDLPSYFLAETLKYLLLMFGPDDYVSLDDFVFTTEAHPLRRRSQLIEAPKEEDYSYSTVSAPFPLHLWSVVLLIFLVVVGVAKMVPAFAWAPVDSAGVDGDATTPF